MDGFSLMMKDKKVMDINFDEAIYNITDDILMPFQLKDVIRRVPAYEDIHSRYDDTQRQIAINKNYEAVIGFLAARTLPITRTNAKKIYNLFGLDQLQDDMSKTKVAVLCRALSLQDNYWIKLNNENISWDKVNLRTNSLSETVAQVSLHGTSLSLTDKSHEALRTPELTGQGSYAKAWMREDDGLYLYKTGDKDDTEARIEVTVSNLLDNCNVDHLEYKGALSDGKYVCKCKCMTTDNVSILPGMDFISYCNRHGLNAHAEALRIDPDSIYKMAIVDYLISNRDRHGLNWGFFYDCNTMEILKCHPLYDHNNSFDIGLMRNANVPYLYDDRYTMKMAAQIGMQHTDFSFYRAFLREDFMTDIQCESFMNRAEELGIRIIPKKVNEDSKQHDDNEEHDI